MVSPNLMAPAQSYPCLYLTMSARPDSFFTHGDLPLILHSLSSIQDLFLKSCYNAFLHSTFCHLQLSQINALLFIILTFKSCLIFGGSHLCTFSLTCSKYFVNILFCAIICSSLYHNTLSKAEGQTEPSGRI